MSDPEIVKITPVEKDTEWAGFQRAQLSVDGVDVPLSAVTFLSSTEVATDLRRVRAYVEDYEAFLRDNQKSK